MEKECKLHFKAALVDTDLLFFKKIKQQSLINIWGWTLNLNWSDIKVKTKN